MKYVLYRQDDGTYSMECVLIEGKGNPVRDSKNEQPIIFIDVAAAVDWVIKNDPSNPIFSKDGHEIYKP